MMNMTRALKVPPVKWEALADRLSTAERWELMRQLDQHAVSAARLAAYITRRISGGRHVDAVKRQNAVARKVRLAIGYSYPEDSLTF